MPLPKSTALDVRVAAPVPPYVAEITPAFHVPDVTFPPTDRSVPTYNFFAIPAPPAVIIDPVIELELSVAIAVDI